MLSPSSFVAFTMARPSKQQRIDVGSDCHSELSRRMQAVVNLCSTDAAVRKLLQTWEGRGPSHSFISSVRGARFDSLKASIPLPLVDGSTWEWPICHPGLLLSRVVSESVALQAGFREALAKHPCSASAPWGLVVGFDEHIPGNKLALNPARKSMNLSFSFQELGGLSCHDIGLGSIKN